MYLPASTPVPQNSQDPPRRSTAMRRNFKLARMGQAIDKGRTAHDCAYLAAITTQPPATIINGLYPPPQVPLPGGLSEQKMPASARTSDYSTLSDSQRQDIDDAPQIIEQYSTGKCLEAKPDEYCPITVSNPYWGNSTLQFPAPACPSASTSVIEAAKSNPWMLLLLAAGAILAVDWLTE